MSKRIARSCRIWWRTLLAFPALAAVPAVIELSPPVIAFRHAGADVAESNPLLFGWGLVNLLSIPSLV